MVFAKFAGLRQAYDHVLHTAGRNPFELVFDDVVSPTEATLDGRLVLLFGTNNYLGATFDAACIADAAEALRTHGTGTTGSRIANGSYGGHKALERRLAEALRRRSAMVFTTGYQANLGVLSALAGRDDHLLLDADSHASIYDGSRLGHAPVTRFRHNDPDDLHRRLRLLADSPGAKLIVVEGVYSMLGDLAPLREIVAVKKETGAWLLVDEAHSLGVLGESGRGLAEAAGVEADVDFVVGTFSKSLGSIGGFCASDHPEMEFLRLAARSYMFTASLPPSIVASVSRALDLLADRPELRADLSRNAMRLYEGLSAAGLPLGPTPSPIVAVQVDGVDRALRAWAGLLDRGVYVNLALPPATPGRRALLRCSVSAAHTAPQIDRALAAFRDVMADPSITAGDPATLPDVAD